VGLLSGAAPAVAAARANVHGALKESSRGSADSARRRRIRNALVVSEFAMALVLLVSAGLAIRSFAALLAVDPGFDPRNTLSLQVSVKGTPQADTSRRRVFFGEMIERVRALPGVVDVSAINHLPLDGDDWHFPFAVEGRAQPATGDGPKAQFLVVRPGYFRTMGIPVRQGRDFTRQDEASAAHVVIVNEAMARRHWPNESPVGQRITVDDAVKHPDWFTVVGVTKDVRQGSWTGASDEAMYFPSIGGGPYPGNAMPLVSFLNPQSMTLVVRVSADRAAILPAIERTVASMERDAAISHVLTMDEAIASEFTQPRFYLLLLGVFAGVALALSAVGVYGVISYSVARRRQELGVRMALGAQRGEVFRLVVGQGMRLALLGGGIGLVMALVTTRFLRTLLYGVRPTDPATFVLVAAVLALVALAACAIPARRASHVDPAEVLKC
jgi:predicted permease